jgi:hypothetical protein
LINEEEWTPPLDLDVAHRERRRLIAAIEEIKAQLTSRKVTRRLGADDEEEYHVWRRRTIWAQTNRLQELRLLNDWIRDQRVKGR